MYTHRLKDFDKAVEYGFEYGFDEDSGIKMCLVTEDLRVVIVNLDDSVWCLNDELQDKLTDLGILERVKNNAKE